MLNGITIVGAGNLAWHLALGFHKAGVRINTVVSRSLKHAKELANQVSSRYSSDISDIPIETDIVFLCVTDSAIVEVAKLFLNKNLRIVHTSGSMPLTALGDSTNNCGVFYPFQTFSKQVKTGELSFPVCIEADNNKFENLLISYASKISDKVVLLDSFQRMRLHLSGVMLNNFSNHLFARTFDFVEANNIDADLLLPILEETVNKIKINHPKSVQTGPAVRRNSEIIKKHVDLLSNNASLQNIYEVMTKSIEEYYSKDNK